MGKPIKATLLKSAALAGLRFATVTTVTKRTRTEVSLEIQEDVAIRTHRISMAVCPVCGSEVRMIPADEAAMMAKLTARDIYHRVNTGQLHFTEDHHGLLYICLESLRSLGAAELNQMAKATETPSE